MQSITEALDPLLDPDKVYFAYQTKSTYGASGGSIFFFKDGITCYDDLDEIDDALDDLPDGLFDLTSDFPPHTKLRYTFQKGAAMKMEPCTPEMLLEDILQSYRERAARREATKIETRITFLKKKDLKLDAAEITFSEGKEPSEREFSCARDDYKLLYHATSGKLEKLHAIFEGGKLTLSTLPALPGLNLPELKESVDTSDFNPEKLESIYAYLESGIPQKIELALAALDQNAELKTQAEDRYLNLIRARTNSPEAGLEAIGKAVLNKVEVNLILGKYLTQSFISYSYMDEDETKLIVDFIGAMVKNTLDVEAFLAEAKGLNDEKALANRYEQHAKKIKSAAQKQAKNYPEGWYSQLVTKFLSMKLEKVMFEKTSFGDANGSLVLREYMFFLNLNRSSAVYLDIHQSDTPELTEVFWLLPKVPTTNWSDVEPAFPASPLSFPRKARMRVGDFGKWKTITRPK